MHRPLRIVPIVLLLTVAPSSAQEAVPTRLLDLNGDQRPDRVRVAAGRLTVDWNRGGRVFERGTLPELGPVSVVEALDLDADGAPDLVLGGALGLVALVNDGAEGFVERTAELGLAHPGSVLGLGATDLDGDQRPDLLVQGVERDVVLWSLAGGGFERDDALFAGDLPWTPPLAPIPGTIPDSSVAAEAGTPALEAGTLSITRASGSSRVPARASAPAPTIAPVASAPGPACLDSIEDTSTGSCLLADSTPTLGRLYPLGPELFIDPAGQVGVGTLAPTAPLTVAGTVESTSGGFRFPDGSVQTTAVAPGGTAVPAGARVLWESGTPPAGYSATGQRIRVDGFEAWENLADSAANHEYPSVSAVNGRLYVFSRQGAEAYDPDLGTWSALTMPSVPRERAITGVIGNEIFLCGGFGFSGSSLACEAYDVTTDTWRTLASAPVPHERGFGAVVGGKLYAFGGVSGGTQLTAVSIYDPVLDSWSGGTPLAFSRYWGGCAAVGTTIYLIGGFFNGNALSSVLTYDTGTDTYGGAFPLPLATYESAAVVSEGTLLLLGGRDSMSFHLQNYRYLPQFDTWQEETPFASTRSGAGAAVLEGEVYVHGGSVNNRSRLDVLRSPPTLEILQKD